MSCDAELKFSVRGCRLCHSCFRLNFTNMDMLIALFLIVILWPVLSWSRILLQDSTLNLSIFNSLSGALLGYVTSEFIIDNSVSYFVALFPILSAYKSRLLYPKKHLIISTIFFLISFFVTLA